MTNRKILLLAVIAAAVSMNSSCYYDSVEELNPDFGLGSCDTFGIISFSAKVQPIMDTYCGTQGNQAAVCHGTGNPDSGIPLSNHSEVSDAEANEAFMDAIRHTNGASPMPQGGGKLDDCKIATIQKWIDQGKQNN